MKKLLFLLFFLCGVCTASAQFDKGIKYINTSLSGLGASYSSSEKFRLGVSGSVGYFISDCFLLGARAGYDHTRRTDDVSIGGFARYYFDQCGVFVGAGGEYVHYSPKSNDVQIPVEVGYAFFVNRFITIEPSVYYKMSLHSFSDNSTVGVRLGLGFYF